MEYIKKIPIIIKEGILNIFIFILVLSPILSYMGYSMLAPNFISSDNQSFIHWSGLDPHTEVYVTWETTQESGTYVKYGTDPTNLDQYFENTTVKNMHQAHLTGLNDNTRYYYRVGPDSISDTSSLSPIRSFKTAPSTYKEFNATFISDTQQIWGLGGYDKVGKAIKNNGDTGFVAILGDLVQTDDNQQHWDQFFKESVYSDRVPLVPVPGNHDGIGSSDSLYPNYFGITEDNGDVYYSFNWSNTQFIVAQFDVRDHLIYLPDSEDEEILRKTARNKAHFEWLNETLENGQGMDFRIMLYHIHENNELNHIIEKYNVSLVLHGHGHQYIRRYNNNHTYIQLGNGATIQSTVVDDYKPEVQEQTNGVGFTQLFINSTGIKVTTLNPTLEIMDSVFLRRESPTSGILIPDSIRGVV